MPISDRLERDESDEDRDCDLAPDQVRLVGDAAIVGGQPEQRDDAGRRRVVDVARQAGEVVETQLALRLVAPAEPPDGEQGERHGEDEEAPGAAAPAEQDVDERADREDEAEAGEGERRGGLPEVTAHRKQRGDAEAEVLAVLESADSRKVIGLSSESFARRRYVEEIDQATRGVLGALS